MTEFKLMPKAPDGTPKEDGIEYCTGDSVGTVEGVMVFPLMPTGRAECVNFRLAPWPVVDFATDPDVACTGVPVQFTNLSDYGEDFLWDFGDGTTSTEENPAHTYSAGGYKRIELTVGNIAGERTVGRNGEILVKVQPAAAFSYTTVGNFSHYFTDESTGDVESYLWNFGDGNTSTSRNPSHIYAGDGTYTVTLTAGNSVCADSIATQEIVIAAATWHEMTDDTFWANVDTWGWGGSICSAGDGWCYYGGTGAHPDGHANPVSIVATGTWASGWRPSKIIMYGCDYAEYFWLRDTAGNVIAEGGPGGAGHPITWQGNDIAKFEFTQLSDSSAVYGCVTGIHFYGPAPA